MRIQTVSQIVGLLLHGMQSSHWDFDRIHSLLDFPVGHLEIRLWVETSRGSLQQVVFNGDAEVESQLAKG